MCFDFDSNDFTIHLLAVASRFAASHRWREPCRVCSFVFNMSIEDDDSAALFLWGRHDSLISLSSQNFIIFSYSLLAVFLLLVVVAHRHAFQSERDTVSREREKGGRQQQFDNRQESYSMESKESLSRWWNFKISKNFQLFRVNNLNLKGSL